MQDDEKLTMDQLGASSTAKHATSEVFSLLSEVAGPTKALVLVEGGKAWAEGALNGKENDPLQDSASKGLPQHPYTAGKNKLRVRFSGDTSGAGLTSNTDAGGGEMLAAAWMLRAQDLERQCADLRQSAGRHGSSAAETLSAAEAAIAEVDDLRAARAQAEMESSALMQLNIKLERELRTAAHQFQLMQLRGAAHLLNRVRRRCGRLALVLWTESAQALRRGRQSQTRAGAHHCKRLKRGALLRWSSMAMSSAEIRETLSVILARSGLRLASRGTLSVWRRLTPPHAAARRALQSWALAGWAQSASRRIVEDRAVAWMRARLARRTACLAMREWLALAVRNQKVARLAVRRPAQARRRTLITATTAWHRWLRDSLRVRAARRRVAVQQKGRGLAALRTAARSAVRARGFLEEASRAMLGHVRQRDAIAVALACGRARCASQGSREVRRRRQQHCAAQALGSWRERTARARHARLAVVKLRTRARLAADAHVFSRWRVLHGRARRAALVETALGVQQLNRLALVFWGWLRRFRGKARARRVLDSLSRHRQRGQNACKEAALRGWAWLSAGQHARMTLWRELTRAHAEVTELRAAVAATLEAPEGTARLVDENMRAVFAEHVSVLGGLEGAVVRLVREAARRAERPALPKGGLHV